MAFMYFRKFFYSKIFYAFIILTLVFSLNGTASQTQEGEKELFLVAQKAFEDGFYDVAMRYITQLFNQYPKTDKHIQANLLLGQCYFFKSQYLKAYDIFQKLLQYSDFKDATLFWLGETYLKGSDYREAEKRYRQLIKVYPESIYTPQAYYSLGWVYFEQNKFEEAKSIFAKFIQQYPVHQLTEEASFKLGEAEYNLRHYEDTIQYFKKYILRYPQSTRHAESYFYIAEAYYYLEDYLSAAGYYAKSAEIAYDSKLILMSRVSLGWCYLKLEKFTLAQKYFDEAYQFSQEKGIFSDDVFLGQANLYAKTGEHKKALEAYSRLIEQFPNSKRIFEAYLGQANTYYLLEKYSHAILSYQALIDKSPEKSGYRDILEKAQFGLAWSYLKADNIDASIKIFEDIKNKADNDIVKISALTQIGDAYQDAGYLEKSIEIYDQILKNYEKSPYTDYVQYRQGIVLLKMDKIEAATLSFQSLQANFPESKYLNDVQYYLAVAYFKKGNWSAAQEQIEAFIKILPKYHEFLAESEYIFALSTFNLEQYKKAIKLFQKIIKNHPDQSAMIKNAEMSIAKCYYKLGNKKEALKRFKRIVIRWPQSEVSHESLIWLGDHYLEVMDFDNAIFYYTQLVNIFPGSDKLEAIYYEIGQAYQAKKEYDQAINAFKHIRPSNDAQLYAKAKLAIAGIFSKKLNPVSAIETYQNIIETSPEFRRDAYVKMAEVYKASEKYEKVVEAYTSALKANKGMSAIESAQLQFFIGDMYEFLNKKDRAMESYFKIPYIYTENSPWAIKAYLRIARIFEDEESWEKAKSVYKKIVDLNIVESKFAQERMEWIKVNVR